MIVGNRKSLEEIVEMINGAFVAWVAWVIGCSLIQLKSFLKWVRGLFFPLIPTPKWMSAWGFGFILVLMARPGVDN